MEDNFRIKISGSGDKQQIIQALKDVITSIEDKETMKDLEKEGETQLEDNILYTELYIDNETEG